MKTIRRCPGLLLNIINVQLTSCAQMGFVLLSQNFFQNKRNNFWLFKFINKLLGFTYQTIYTLCHHVLYIHSFSMVFPWKSNMDAGFSIVIWHVIIFPIQRVSNFGFCQRFHENIFLFFLFVIIFT